MRYLELIQRLQKDVTNDKTAKELYTSLQTNNLLSNFSAVETVATFANELTAKPYYIRYKELFFVCVVLSFVAQIASLISSYAYFEGVFAVAIKHPYLLVLGVMVVLMTIEILKRFLLTNSLQSWFGLQRTFAPLPTFFAVLLSVMSMYASVTGGGSFGVDLQKEVATATVHHTNTDSLAKVYDTEIGVIRSEIASIEKRNSYKGTTYLPKKEKELVHAKEQRIRELQAAKDTDIANHKSKAAKELETVRTENQTNKATYQYWFLGFELLFLACMVFMYDYKRKSVLESLLSQNTEPNQTNNENRTTKIVNEPNQQNTTTEPTPTAPIPTQPQRIGFVFGQTAKPTKETLPTNENRTTIIVNENSSGLRTCKHCQKEYAYKHHKQQYCTEICRVESWEQRTGKKLNKGKK
jgi:hypothetical protein